MFPAGTRCEVFRQYVDWDRLNWKRVEWEMRGGDLSKIQGLLFTGNELIIVESCTRGVVESVGRDRHGGRRRVVTEEAKSGVVTAWLVLGQPCKPATLIARP
ncbi:hypothetical protein N7462_008572 [Penicillium macrosclerotiorum]|uniref:uncharacterized protein n=1 Tax=Penicillium macrosclerotiorum TaxID=303699 RepID=UPI002547CF50|nr:uncharacterized protein N7462_008572 [Penicillium macrosclerotiorum]KAJ5675675.1 hypothetical protein N7462_008572 [Penicillium macrosclerotiorum]